MNYYPFHVGDYMAHTAHLEPLEDLAYRRLLDLYYLREEPIPADVDDAARLVRMRANAAEVSAVLSEFFELTPDGWRHARCDTELEAMKEKRAKASASGKASAKARRNGRSTNAQRSFNERSTNVQLPTPTPTPEDQKLLREPAEPVPAAALIPLNDGSEFPVTEAQAAEYAALYPAVDVPDQLRRMRAWSLSNPKNRKTRSGVLRFVNGWLAKAQNEAPRANAPRDGPPKVGKTMGAIQLLEEMKRGLAETGNRDGNPEAALPRLGRAASG